MRKIYLIRHGKPDLPPGSHICLGRTDPGLSAEGHRQAAELAGYMSAYSITEVFCSTLRRSRQTAEYLSSHPTEASGFEEQDQGEWDGLSFSEIRRKWPELYERRGEHPGLEPPGGEPSGVVAERFLKSVTYALSVSRGDIAIVSHRAAIQLFLCKINGRSFDDKTKFPIACASAVTLLYENGRFWQEETDTMLL